MKSYFNRLSIYFLLVCIAFLPILDLFHPGLPLTHDGQDHVARIASFYKNLEEGTVVPRWAANLNWGYGHPILMFLYPLPSYSASFFHFLGFSLIGSLKIVFGISFVASGFAMYFWIKEFLGKEAGIVAAVLYLFAPYRFVDLYVRGAIGEHVAFVFPPLICYFLLRTAKKYSYWYLVGGSVSIAGLILSHNAITIMFLPIISFYAIYLLYQNDNKKLIAIRYTLIAIIGFGLSSFFLFPAFLEGKYTLRDIVTKDVYMKSFVDLKDFFFGEWNYGGTGQFTVEVGILQWMAMCLMIPISIKFWKQKDRKWMISIAALLIFFATLFLMTSLSSIIWQVVTILQKFQFPWRFLSVVVFICALCGGLFVFTLSKQKKTIAVIFIIVVSLLIYRNIWHAKEYMQRPEGFYTSVYYGTTDTGESAPIWSVRFMEKPPKSHVEVIGGKAIILEKNRTSTTHKYEIEALTDKTQIRENTLYFPGWEVLVDNMPVHIEFQSAVNRGVMTYFLEKGKHTVVVNFRDTRLRVFANLVSVVSLAILMFSYILGKRKLWQHFQ